MDSLKLKKKKNQWPLNCKLFEGRNCLLITFISCPCHKHLTGTGIGKRRKEVDEYYMSPP